MDPQRFRSEGHALIDWLADEWAARRQRRVCPDIAPGDLTRELPSEFPESPQPGPAIDLAEWLSRGTTWWDHPGFHAWFPANTHPASVLADLVAAGLGGQAMTWHSAPASTELEAHVLNAFRVAIGLSDAWTGIATDTASTGTLTALLLARSRARGRVLASEEAHSSVAKGARLADLPFDLVPADADGAMNVEALGRIAAVGPVSAIVSTIGTTTTTAIDPVAAIVASQPDAWHHVDAALAGNAMLLPECRTLWDGVEGADSIVVNPHKWLGVGFDLSVLFVRDVEAMRAIMATDPSYLRTPFDALVTPRKDLGIPLGRRNRALKLWAVARVEGLAGLRARLRADLHRATRVADHFRARPDWRVLAPARLQTVVARWQPAHLSDAAADRANLAIVAALNRTGRHLLTQVSWRGRPIVRISVGALDTTDDDISVLLDALDDTVAEVSTLR